MTTSLTEKLDAAGYTLHDGVIAIQIDPDDPACDCWGPCGGDCAAGRALLDEIRAIVGDQYTVEWTGDANDDSDGNTTCDAVITEAK